MDVAETFVDAFVQIKKKGELLMSTVVKFILQSVEVIIDVINKVNPVVQLLLTVGSFVFWNSFWYGIKDGIDEVFEPIRF